MLKSFAVLILMLASPLAANAAVICQPGCIRGHRPVVVVPLRPEVVLPRERGRDRRPSDEHGHHMDKPMEKPHHEP